MANRWLQQFFYSYNKAPVFIEGNFTVGASGAVGTVKGSGVQSITKLSTGTYLLKLEDKFYRYLAGMVNFIAPVTGADVTAGSFIVGTTYRITALGTTSFTAIGARANVVGATFVATGAGTGTGTAKAVGTSGILGVEVADTSVSDAIADGTGVIVQCLDAAGAVANPANGSTCTFSLWVRNSSIKGKGE